MRRKLPPRSPSSFPRPLRTRLGIGAGRWRSPGACGAGAADRSLVQELVGVTFRLVLERADVFRTAVSKAAHAGGFSGFLFFTIACAIAVSTAAWLVRRFSPFASGSGIPHVEAVLNEELPQAPFRLIPIKFAGGLLAIGSGLALGREGPSVQMGASIAHLTGQMFRRNWPDCRGLFAAGAGAGLATAFNAPIAGAVFVLEELVRRFEPRIAIAALGASTTAITISRAIGGGKPDFSVEVLASASPLAHPLFFVLGAFAGGFAAILYNRLLLKTMAAAAGLTLASLKPGAASTGAVIGAIAWCDVAFGVGAAVVALVYHRILTRMMDDGADAAPVELRAWLIGAAVGILGWSAPGLVGGGDALTQKVLGGSEALAIVPLIFALRLVLGSVSYAAGTPGGLFAPLLVLGAQLGFVFGCVCKAAFPGLDIQPTGFAVVGMTAFFTGVVRAPLTGIVLVSEMTSSVAMLLPMLSACFIAMVVTDPA